MGCAVVVTFRPSFCVVGRKFDATSLLLSGRERERARERGREREREREREKKKKEKRKRKEKRRIVSDLVPRDVSGMFAVCVTHACIRVRGPYQAFHMPSCPAGTPDPPN